MITDSPQGTFKIDVGLFTFSAEHPNLHKSFVLQLIKIGGLGFD